MVDRIDDPNWTMADYHSEPVADFSFMNKPGWRPQDWKYMWAINMIDGQGKDYRKQTSESIVFEAGASAMLKAVVEWLLGYCDKHWAPSEFKTQRCQCSKCWFELKVELKGER